MKLKGSLLLIFLSLALAGQAMAIGTSNTMDATNEQHQVINSQKDNEIIALLIVLNRNEIVMANLVLKKGVNISVKRYAMMMHSDHEEGLKKTLKLGRELHIKPVQTKETISLMDKGQKELASLHPLQKD